ncbi:MAG: DeoR family transcriptional regulator, partial [Patescibacteria group bacterium]
PPESEAGVQEVKKEAGNTMIDQGKSEMVGEKISKQNNIIDRNFFGKQRVRQQKIISILEERSLNEFQLKDVLNEFPNFNEKTVRNDLKVLCESGVLERNGAGRSSVYKVIRQTSNN